MPGGMIAKKPATKSLSLQGAALLFATRSSETMNIPARIIHERAAVDADIPE
jgi:hypothetical protein